MSDYAMLGRSGCVTADGIDDALEWKQAPPPLLAPPPLFTRATFR